MSAMARPFKAIPTLACMVVVQTGQYWRSEKRMGAKCDAAQPNSVGVCSTFVVICTSESKLSSLGLGMVIVRFLRCQ
jgi:hypothetical protein